VPRRAPDGKGVSELRITLGDFERREIKQALDEIEKTKRIQRYGITAAAGGAVVVGGIGAYALWTMAMAGAGLIDRALSFPGRAFNWFTGKADSLWDDVFNQPPSNTWDERYSLDFYERLYPDLDVAERLMKIAEDRLAGYVRSQVSFEGDYSEYKRLSQLWGFYEPRPQPWQYEDWDFYTQYVQYHDPELSYPAALAAWETRRREAEDRYLRGLVTDEMRETQRQVWEEGRAYVDPITGVGQVKPPAWHEGDAEGIYEIPDDVVMSIFPPNYPFDSDPLGLKARADAGEKLYPQDWSDYVPERS